MNRSLRTLNDEAAFSACDYRHRKTEKQSLGLYLRHVEERPRLSVICQRRWNSSLAIRSTSPSKGCIRDFETDCFGSLRSRIPSSTKRRRCVFRHTASHASSPAPRISRITSDCRAAALMTFARRSPILVFARPVRDERRDGSCLEVKFQGELRQQQKAAADAMLRHETGVLAATTAFGKTVVAAWLIARRGVNTLVLVHRRQLLDQWIKRLSTFLDVPAKSIGRIGGGRNRPTGQIDVGIIQSLVRKGVVDDRVAESDHLIVDECHHLSAHSFELVVPNQSPICRWLVGNRCAQGRPPSDHLHAVRSGSTSGQRSRTGSMPPDVRALRPRAADVPTEQKSYSRQASGIPGGVRELVDDQPRNRRICDDVVDSVSNGRSPFVLTERNEHLDRLATRARGTCPSPRRLARRNGKEAAAGRRRPARSHPARRSPASSWRQADHVGEGFDDARVWTPCS